MRRLLYALVFLLCLTQEASASWSVITSVCAGVTDGGDGTTALTSGTIDTTGADLLIAFSSAYVGASSITFSDSKSNTWTGLTNTVTNRNSRIWYAFGPTVGSGHTFTVGGGDGSLFNQAFCVMAVSGKASGDPFDSQNTNANSASATITSGSITPLQSGELIVSGFSSAATAASPAVDSGFTLVNSISGSGHDVIGLGYLIQGAASAVNPTWTTDSAVNNQAAIASFKVSTGVVPIRRRRIIFQ